MSANTANITVNIHQAKTQFSRLVELATSGKEIIITKSGKPVARLIPYAPKGAVRRPGTMRGKIRIKKNFDGLFRSSTFSSGPRFEQVRSQRGRVSADDSLKVFANPIPEKRRGGFETRPYDKPNKLPLSFRG